MKKELEIKKKIDETYELINQVELAGFENIEDRKYYRKLQKRKLYLKAKLKGFKQGKEEILNSLDKIIEILKPFYSVYGFVKRFIEDFEKLKKKYEVKK